MLLSSANVDKRIEQAIRAVVHVALGVHLHKARADALKRLDMRQELVDPNGGIDSLLHYSASFAATGAAGVPAGVSPAPATATNPSSPSSTPPSQVAAPPTVSGSPPVRITASF